METELKIDIASILKLKDTTSKESITKSLEFIAKELILKTALKINDSMYSLIDIEAYYYHEYHRDTHTLDHERMCGELEAHRYGVDLSLGFGNQNNIPKEGYGGFLIRGLYDLNKNIVIEKSEVRKVLFNQLCIGSNSIEWISMPQKLGNDIFKSRRINLGKENDFTCKKYRYLLKAEFIFKEHKYNSKSGKKTFLFENSNLSDDEIKIYSGYKIKKIICSTQETQNL
ncbi:MAG: hypothetical protein KF900_06495 [Bacteroidetes bacterium]|nr:hypothetical protein [Bacteroidota bacterium]